MPLHALACRECVSSYLSNMSERRKANVSGAVYFMTLTVVDRVDVFTRTELVEEILVNLRLCQKHYGRSEGQLHPHEPGGSWSGERAGTLLPEQRASKA